jgi:hypothetical protein
VFRLTWPGVSVLSDGDSLDVRVQRGDRWLVIRERDGVWLSLDCETPGEHYTIGLEAFALEVDHPDDELGHLVPLGFDLEWEAPGRVHGELLIADERIELDVPGELTLD